MITVEYDQTKVIVLRKLIIAHFNEGELRDLCFDLGIDYENLPAQGKSDKARELVAYTMRYRRTSELVTLCRQLRPAVDWPSVGQAVASPAASNRQPLPPKETNPQRRVSATIGALRITLDQSAPGWMLSAENIGNQELTSITITLRPPSSVLIARPRVEIPRLSVGNISKPHSLGLKADSTVTVPFSLVYRRTGVDGIDRHNGTITIAS